MERLSYEINRLGEVNSEMDEARNEAEVRILELENALENAKRLLQVRDQEAEALEAAMQKRTEALNNAVKGATEKMHEEIASVKATLRAKSAELQVRVDDDDIRGHHCMEDEKGSDLPLCL